MQIDRGEVEVVFWAKDKSISSYLLGVWEAMSFVLH